MNNLVGELPICADKESTNKFGGLSISGDDAKTSANGRYVEMTSYMVVDTRALIG